ncbi:MAG: polysaccharide deacetylase family protein, partial [Anaerolineae bacterium]|nr:polysaccharide deacetylase family protein [Anaerolineae bacterium]
MKTPKPIASLSLDLDDKWTYMKIHGDEGWENFPSYFDVFVPRVLSFLKDLDLRITFMVVGQDAKQERNWELLKSIAAAGHEIGNHSLNHESWMHLYAEEDIESDLIQAETAIFEATGIRPVGFRGPGFSIGYKTMQVLARRGYVYDASTFPTYLGPLARAYYFMTTRLTPEEKAKRRELFGTFKDGLRTNAPYRWRYQGDELVEIPVSTFPVFKVPIHISYVLYLSMFSRRLALFYFQTALEACRLTGLQPSILLHPLDFLGADDNINELAFFPAMSLKADRKIQ